MAVRPRPAAPWSGREGRGKRRGRTGRRGREEGDPLIESKGEFYRAD